MRARELLEDYNQSLESDLENLLIAAKGNGIQEVQTSDIVDQLYGMGYSVDVNSIMMLLSNSPTVMNATPEMITLTAPEGSAQGGDTDAEDNANAVSDMAMSNAEQGIDK